MNPFPLVLLLAFATACDEKPARQVPVASPSPIVVASPSPSPSPQDLIVVFKEDKTYRAKEVETLRKAEVKVTELFRSECFEKFFLARAVIQTNEMTKSEVLAFIRSKKDSVPVTMYNKPGSNVIGYRQPPSRTIHTNRAKHGGASVCFVARSLGHEYTHVIGFKHDFEATKRRPFSVPYSVTEGFKKCCL